MVVPVVPLAGDTDSQFPVELALAEKGTDIVGVVVTVKLWAGGLLPFTEANVKLEGLAFSVKAAEVTLKVTGTLSGEFVAAP
jgi:hypothetical protein